MAIIAFPQRADALIFMGDHRSSVVDEQKCRRGLDVAVQTLRDELATGPGVDPVLKKQAMALGGRRACFGLLKNQHAARAA